VFLIPLYLTAEIMGRVFWEKTSAILREQRHRMRMGKGRVQQIGEEIFRLSISFHDVPTLSPFPLTFSSFPCRWMSVKEGTQDKRVSSSLPHPHKQPLPSRKPILLQRNENYPTSIIHIPAPSFFWRTLSCDVKEILVLLVTVEFSPLGVFCCRDIPDRIVKWELKCLVQLVPSPRALLLLFMGASAILWRYPRASPCYWLSSFNDH